MVSFRVTLDKDQRMTLTSGNSNTTCISSIVLIKFSATESDPKFSDRQRWAVDPDQTS